MAERKYAGNVPNSAAGWGRIGATEHDGVEWSVYRQRARTNEDWYTIKVVAGTQVTVKANYWWARNSKTGQEGHVTDLVLLKRHRPGLHAQVLRIVREARL